MNKNNNRPDVNTNLSRTPHPMSQHMVFTAAPHMMLPTYRDFLLAGDTIDISCVSFLRTNPLSTAAISDIDYSVDYFFVPATMIYSAFGEHVYHLQSYLSSRFGTPNGASLIQNALGDNLPTINFMDFFNNVDSVQATAFNGDSGWEYMQYGLVVGRNRFDCPAKNIFRLFMHLQMNPYVIGNTANQYGDIPDGSSVLGLLDHPSVFPMWLAAYHAIYYKHYRLEDLEADAPLMRNLDWMIPTSGTGSVNNYMQENWLGEPWLLRFCMYHSLPRVPDYWTQQMTSPIIGGMSITNNLDESFGSETALYDGTIENMDASANFNAILSNATGFGLNTDMSTAALRAMFAREKFLRISGRANKTYEAQILAHFGFKIKHDILHDYTYIGSDEGTVHIGEVISTANTSSLDGGSPLGEIAGKGYGKFTQNRSHKFTAPCHGILMAIFHLAPRQITQTGFDRTNMITTINDFYQPEFDKLGAQPVYRFELDINFLGENAADRIGWQYRYQQWKRKADWMSYAFYNPRPMVGDTVRFNNYSSWLASFRWDTEHNLPVPSNPKIVETLRANVIGAPNALDNLFITQYSNGWSSEYWEKPWTMFYSDPFIVDLKFTNTKVSVMSKTGEPDLDGIK